MGSSLWLPRPDGLALPSGDVAYGIALAGSVCLGTGALPFSLHRAVLTAGVGVVCLGSVSVNRLLFLIQPAIRNANRTSIDDRSTIIRTSLGGSPS